MLDFHRIDPFPKTDPRTESRSAAGISTYDFPELPFFGFRTVLNYRKVIRELPIDLRPIRDTLELKGARMSWIHPDQYPCHNCGEHKVPSPTFLCTACMLARPRTTELADRALTAELHRLDGKPPTKES